MEKFFHLRIRSIEDLFLFLKDIMNILAYAGSIHQFEINQNGYLQIDIFGYDNQIEKFVKIIDKPLIPSITIKSNQCIIVASCLIDKGLGVLLHLISTNSSILMFLQFQSRPWLCHILYTLSIPLLTYGSMKFLSINSLITIFINEDKYLNGFYIIQNNNHQDKSQRNIQFIQCSLLTYIYSYLKDNYYWVMGTEIDLNTQRKLIKVNFDGLEILNFLFFRFTMVVQHLSQHLLFHLIQINLFLYLLLIIFKLYI